MQFILIASILFTGKKKNLRSGTKLYVEVGQIITIPCTIQNDVQWYFGVGPLPDNAVIKNNGAAITIENVQLLNSGLYTCKGNFEFLTVEDGIILVVKGKQKKNTHMKYLRIQLLIGMCTITIAIV